MAQEVSPTGLNMPASATFDRFLELIKEGTKDEVETFLTKTARTKTKSSHSQNDLSTAFADALEEKNVVEVWKLIAEANENEKSETLENLTEVCRTIAEKENNKNRWNFKKMWKTLKDAVYRGISWIFNCDEDDIEEETEMRLQKEQKWIKIFSNPLYISLEWLWRNNPKSQYKKGIRRKESKFADIIEATLDDAYLLGKIASYDQHYNREEYKQRAIEYEKFAANIVEGIDPSDLNQLREIMDINGNGCLLKKKPCNFNESLSLLKMAADKNRKRFVASPKCQYALNEIVYRGWGNWQHAGIPRKTLWFVFHLFFVTLTCLVYIPVRLMQRCCCSHKFKVKCCWKFRKFYEHPYSKFINHAMPYLVFLCFLFASSFQDKFGTTITGLAWIDYPVLAFVVGLFLQVAQEIIRRGFFSYFSKWWNVVETLIVFLFLLSYVIWLSAWVSYGEWKPRKPEFTVSDIIYASGTVIAFFHLAHMFQVNSVLGPLQLSLYKMLKDVLKFLVIFLLLYFAFATGVIKIYSYYITSQNKLQDLELDHSHGHETSHPYSEHTDTFIATFWLLLGNIEEEKIAVKDPAFKLVSTFGLIFMGAHVVCSVIVALNMLIAMMSNSFQTIMENAFVEWQFSRTQMWLEWIDKGNTIPVPFNIVYFFLYCFCPKYCKTCCYKEKPNKGLQQSISLVEVNNRQGDLQVQEELHKLEQNWKTQSFSCISSCTCSDGIHTGTVGCICHTAEKYSMREILSNQIMCSRVTCSLCTRPIRVRSTSSSGDESDVSIS